MKTVKFTPRNKHQHNIEVDGQVLGFLYYNQATKYYTVRTLPGKAIPNNPKGLWSTSYNAKRAVEALINAPCELSW